MNKNETGRHDVTLHVQVLMLRWGWGQELGDDDRWSQKHVDCVIDSKTVRHDRLVTHSHTSNPAVLRADESPVPAELSQCVGSNCCQLRRHKRKARCFPAAMLVAAGPGGCMSPSAGCNETSTLKQKKTWKQINFHGKNKHGIHGKLLCTHNNFPWYSWHVF